MGLISKLSKFARSPQGKKAMRQAQEYAKSPQGKAKIAQARELVANRGKSGAAPKRRKLR
jgi:hypothetical protein